MKRIVTVLTLVLFAGSGAQAVITNHYELSRLSAAEQFRYTHRPDFNETLEQIHPLDDFQSAHRRNRHRWPNSLICFPRARWLNGPVNYIRRDWPGFADAMENEDYDMIAEKLAQIEWPKSWRKLRWQRRLNAFLEYAPPDSQQAIIARAILEAIWPEPTPEPATMTMLALGAIAVVRKRRR